MIYISSDHAGYTLKGKSIGCLIEISEAFEDLGPYSFDKKDDYPLFAQNLCNKVLSNKNSLGILICDTGEGMVISANRFKGIRATLCLDVFLTERSKLHNNANVLVLSGIYNKENYKEIINTFINTPFSNEERHKKRVDMIDKYDNPSNS